MAGFCSASFGCAPVVLLAAPPNVKGARADDGAVDSSDDEEAEDENDGMGAKLKLEVNGAPKETAGLDGAAALVSSSSSATPLPPPPALSSSHDVWSASSYDMPHTGQSPDLTAGAALLAAAAAGAVGLDGVKLLAAGKLKRGAALGVLLLAAVDGAPNVNGATVLLDELFAAPPKPKAGAAAVVLSAVAGVPKLKGAVKDGADGLELAACGLSLPPAAAPSASSSHDVWSASSYDMPHTGQSPVFSAGLLLLAVAALALLLPLLDAAGAVLNAGNVNGEALVDAFVEAPLPNVNGVAAAGCDCASTAGLPKLNDGSDDAPAAGFDELEARDGLEAPKAKGAAAPLLPLPLAAAAPFS